MRAAIDGSYSKSTCALAASGWLDVTPVRVFGFEERVMEASEAPGKMVLVLD